MRKKSSDYFYKAVVESGFYSNATRLEFRLNSIFKGVDFTGKTVLDIGGGIGLLSFFALYKGANSVVILEPEGTGSNSKLYDKFLELKKKLNFQDKDVSFVPQTFQEYSTMQNYDIIVMHDSINHLDEEACMTLNTSIDSERKYDHILKKVSNISNAGTQVIICDCARSNFFSCLKIKNPFAPTIEWNKHQNPGLWIRLFEKQNFKLQGVTWRSLNRLGKLGNVLFSNKFSSFFFDSHFCVVMIKN